MTNTPIKIADAILLIYQESLILIYIFYIHCVLQLLIHFLYINDINLFYYTIISTLNIILYFLNFYKY